MKALKFNIVLGFFLLLSLAIIFRLGQFQIVESDYWKALAQGQHRVFLQTKGDRGEIFITDRLGNLYPLAINRSWEYIYISPREISEKGGDIVKLSRVLGEILEIEEELILARMKRTNSSYEVLKTRLSPQEVDLLKEANLTGVNIRESVIRYYPQDKLAAHVVGFLGGDDSGQYGVEGYYNNKLKGTPLLKQGGRNLQGFLIPKAGGSINSGENLVLTIDYNIQFMAERLLDRAREDLGIEGGTILVGDPHTGEILALANWPNFNPNEFFLENNLGIFINPAIQVPFESGSIFKSITMAIALEEGKITPDTIYNDTGSVRIGGRTIRNYNQRTWGKVNMTEALEKSINTAAVFAKDTVGNEVFTDYLEKFGFFEPTGIDMQGEVVSKNTSFKEGFEINFATASFGQGIDTTSIQLFRAFSALANGGRMVNPHIVDRGNIASKGERVISQKTSADITSMMVSAVENSFARRAGVNGYYVAGKTGTAQVPWSALGIPKRGYSDQTIQSFVGYAPAFDPAFIILVKLDNPRTRTADLSAAPIFGELAKYILNYYQIPPERTNE